MFSIADRESPERRALGVPFDLFGAGTDAPVELRFGPEVRCQPPSPATVSRHASAQAASSTPTPDARLPVHAAQGIDVQVVAGQPDIALPVAAADRSSPTPNARNPLRCAVNLVARSIQGRIPLVTLGR